MNRIGGWKGWLSCPIALAVAILVAGLPVLLTSIFVSPAQAGYELPPGERITNLPHIPRSMPQKEAYENYDPVIGRNFDIKNLWLRADLRVRPEWRNGVCFGSGAPAGGACNTQTSARGNAGKSSSDFYVQQWIRLGIGYDLSPDVNFYFEIIDSANWGSNGNPNNAGNGGDPLNHACGAGGAPTNMSTGCRLGVRAGYVLIRNLADVQGLSVKAGRQYVIFGNHSLFGHFDWANTGYSHDGIMFQYSTKTFDSYLGWFVNSETDLAQAAPVGSLGGNVAGCPGTNAGATPATNPCNSAASRAGSPDGFADAYMFIFYNQIKSVPGFLIEPYYVYYVNNMSVLVNAAQAMGTAKKSNQSRHMLGFRAEMRKGNWDVITENAWQLGSMASGVGSSATAGAEQRNVSINAWATRNWIGYTWYSSKWKPRLAVALDYASGDGNANCTTQAAGGGAITQTAGTRCSSADTFENFFPTNHIHMGYMDIIAWKNMIDPQVNFQLRPTERDHFEFWWNHMRLANAKDNWYRGAQGVYVWSKPTNTAT
ncbi:MAG TPA: alginate export family protein, partial [Nitrospiraceae bacterium]|nr:alginate export family protein [Nitrospiraceae bacterium]